MYGCEIWGITMKTKDITEIGSEIWERFHLRVCKNMLGVHKNTTNIAVLSEMGRYPLSHDIHKQMTKFFLRFEDMAGTRLAKKAFEEQKNSKNDKNWVTTTKNFLDNLGLSYIYNKDISEGPLTKTEINRRSIIVKNRENEISELE